MASWLEFLTFLLAALSIHSTAIPAAMEPGVVLHMGKAPSWEPVAPAVEEDVVQPVFMLRHDAGALASFEQILLDVSTPGHPRYGMHLSRDEVAAALPPVPGARDAVLTWLKEHGIFDVSEGATGDMIQASIPAKKAGEMFETQFHRFRHREKSVELLRVVRPYRVPAHVADKLYLVGNLVQFPSIGQGTTVPADASLEVAGTDAAWPADCGRSCKGLVTPSVLAQAYKLGDAPLTPVLATGMATAEFQGVYNDQGDLDFFKKTCSMPQNITVDKQIGTNVGLKCKLPGVAAFCIEALLDIEYIKAVGGGIPLTNIYVKDFSLLNWAKEIDALEDASLPLVHSLSYGNDEIQQVSGEFMDAVNAQFMKLGARGVSLLAASGDQGVWGRSGPTTRFHPDFPAGSPYITAVGGTDFAEKGVIGEEKAWSSSGGGFSDHFSIPSWQQRAVASYKSAAGSKLPDAKLYNNTGRGYPDVAALGGEQNRYCVAAHSFIFSSMVGVAGTSASCPVVAAIFARVNDLRASKKKPPMGFLNPFIYKNQGAFNDVKQGVNKGFGFEGFEAIPGWDPATGMGTPDFEKLSKAAFSMWGEESIVV